MRRLAAAFTALTALLSPIAVNATVSAAPAVSSTVVSKAQPPRLEFRDKGPAVKVLQRALGMPARGFFTRKTERAVKAFQIRMGIRVTGIVGADTWAALGPSVSRAAARTVATAPAGTLPWQTFAARDTVGYRSSAYQGKYFEPSLEQFRLCVHQREAGGLYRLSNYYQGAYQFSPSWNSTIRSYLRPEMAARYGQAGANAVDDLANSSISSWNRFWQDAAFYAVLAHHGASPWNGGNWGCDSRPNRESGWPNAGYWNYMPFEG